MDLSAFLSLGRFRPLREQEPEPAFAADRPFKDAKSDLIEEFERGYLHDLLDRHRGNISKSAREAGIERAYLQRLIRKYGLK